MMRRDWTLVVATGLVVAACSSNASGSTGSSGASGSSGAAGSSGSSGRSGSSARSGSGGPATSGASGSAGASVAAGASGSAGVFGAAGGAVASGTSGSGSSGASGSAGVAADDLGPQLPEGALLYIRHATADHDLLVARDLASGDELIITDLTGDGSSGWELDGYSLSPDRRRIAIASLYNPTSADTATGLATRAIWTLAVDGTDFRRLTPTFPKDDQGRQGFQYDVGNPEWTADGSQVIYDFGSYWWEGTTFKGASFPWIVSAAGGEAPTSIPTTSDCSVLHPARNPATGDFILIHSVCVPGQGDGAGLYLYPAADGGRTSQKLVASAHVTGSVDVFLEKVSWLADGSGFLFLGGIEETDWRPSLLAYDLTADTVSLIVTAPQDSAIYSAAMAPDASKLVYCLRKDDGPEDLHLIDLSAATPTDTAITTDGKSCYPSF